MFEKKKQVLDFREIRRMLWRRRLLIVLPIVVTTSIAVYQASTMPATYSSTATLAPENPLPLTARVKSIASGGGGGGGGGGGRSKKGSAGLGTRTRIMSSRFLEEVAVEIGLTENAALRARADAQTKSSPNHEAEDLVLRQCVLRLRQMIKVGSGTGGVTNITAVSTSPRLAQIVATAVTDHYLRTIHEIRARANQQTSGFANEQAAAAQARLEEKQDELRRYQQQVALNGLSKSPVSTANLQRLQGEIDQAGKDVSAQQERRNAVFLRIQDNGLDAYLGMGVLDSPTLRAQKQALLEVERGLALSLVEQSAVSGGGAARQQVAINSQKLLTELENLASAELPNLSEDRRRMLVDHEFLQLSVESAQAREDELRRFLDKYASDLASMPTEEIRLKRLAEEVESAQRLYQMWAEQLNATQLAQSVLDTEGLAERLIILEPALLPMRPFAPDRQQIIMVALAMGVALGVGAAVVTEYFDLTLKSVDEIEAVLGAPILGAVPRMQASLVEQVETRRRRRMWFFLSSSILLVAALAAAGWAYFNA